MTLIFYFKSWCLSFNEKCVLYYTTVLKSCFIFIFYCMCCLFVWLMGQLWPFSVNKSTTTTKNSWGANWYTRLTLNVWGPSYSGYLGQYHGPCVARTGHQQPCYWLCKLCRSLSHMKSDFHYLCHINLFKLIQLMACYLIGSLSLLESFA